MPDAGKEAAAEGRDRAGEGVPLKQIVTMEGSADAPPVSRIVPMRNPDMHHRHIEQGKSRGERNFMLFGDEEAGGG